LAFSSALQRRYSFFTCLAPNSPLRRDCESFEAIPQFSAEAEQTIPRSASLLIPLALWDLNQLIADAHPQHK